MRYFDFILDKVVQIDEYNEQKKFIKKLKKL